MTATLALFMTLDGIGWAATELPANSVGKNGTLLRQDFKSGQIPAGPRGAAGPTGAAGAQGPPGPFIATPPSGRSLSGAYFVAGTAAAVSALATDAISFGIPLASAPAPHFIASGTAAPPECPGNAATPTAVAGHLCLDEAVRVNIGSSNHEDPSRA